MFTPETQHNYIYKLSGGERRRLYLCTVLISNPNFLVLDEPTNDLDIVTLNVLEEYLRNFKGCVIVVSHDRYFMDKVVDHLMVFKGNGELKDFPGNYTDYREWKEERERIEREERAEKAKKENKPAAPVRTNDTKKKVRLTFKEKRELEELDRQIPELEAEKKMLETEMSSGTLSADELIAKSNRISELIDQIDTLGMRWLELSELAE